MPPVPFGATALRTPRQPQKVVPFARKMEGRSTAHVAKIVSPDAERQNRKMEKRDTSERASRKGGEKQR